MTYQEATEELKHAEELYVMLGEYKMDPQSSILPLAAVRDLQMILNSHIKIIRTVLNKEIKFE